MNDGASYRDARSMPHTQPKTRDDTALSELEWKLSLLVDFPSESGAGKFTSSDVIRDAGPARYRFVVSGNVIEGVLELEGAAGTLRIESVCTATFRSALAADVEGSFTIVGGDGEYAGLANAGRLSGCLAYDAVKEGFVLNATCRVLR